MKAVGIGRAQGKIILFGEHAVVYGTPAIVTSLPIYLSVEAVPSHALMERKNALVQTIKTVFSKFADIDTGGISLTITSDIPIGSGMGSSAALATAGVRAMADLVEIDIASKDLLDLVMECERFAHGNPSGIDPTAVVIGGLLQFQRKDQILTHRVLANDAVRSKQFTLIQTGKPLETTKEMVAQVRDLLARVPKKRAIIEQIGNLVGMISMELARGVFDPRWLSANERLLEQIEVVSPKARRCIQEIEDNGGYAKVTGAGGKQKGSGLVLAYHDDPEFFEEIRARWGYPLYSFAL